MKYLLVVACCLLLGCEEHDYHTITSPNKDRCLTIDDVNNILRPGFKPYVKIYYGAGAINKDEYIKMRWDVVSGFAVDWGANPIIITDGSVIENTMPANLIKYQSKMTIKDNNEYQQMGSLWRSYDFELIANGEYESCK